jgi:hypothetical protein
MFIASIVLFVLAALGGITLFIRDIQHKPLPKWLAIMHGLVAIIGFAVLFINTFLHPAPTG